MPTKKTDYQALTAKLEAIIEWFESEGKDLDQAIDKYQQALQLIEQIENYLKNAENKIKKINTKFNP